MARGGSSADAATTPAKRAPGADIPLASEFDLKAYRGKVLVVNFWATWCGPCRIEIPALVKLRKSFRPEEVAIVGIATGERVPQAQAQELLKAFETQYGMSYDLFFDHDSRLYDDWIERFALMPAVPLTLLFDTKGALQVKHQGVPFDRRLGKQNPFGILGEEIHSLLNTS